MTKRTRLFVFIAVGILTVGLGTGLFASYMGLPLSALVGSDGPSELKYIPPDASLVAFADVRDVMNSQIRQKLREMRPTAPPNAGDLESKTGISFENDIDLVVAAVLPGEGDGGSQRPLMLARGRFDTVRIEGLVRAQGGQVEDYKGKRLLTLRDHDQDLAVAFVEPGLVAAGTRVAVHLAIDTRNGTRNVTDNAEIMGFVRDIDNENAWAVGRFDALSAGGRLPQQFADQLPPINWFAASGRVDDGIHGSVRVEARDDAAAQNLRDAINGFMALGRLQAGRNAELMAALNSLQIGGQGKTVSLGFSLSPDVINLLSSPGNLGRPGIGRSPNGSRNPRRRSEPSAQPPSPRPQAEVF